jgi:hypothetical protein
MFLENAPAEIVDLLELAVGAVEKGDVVPQPVGVLTQIGREGSRV